MKKKKDGSYLLIRTEWQLQKNQSGEYYYCLMEDGFSFTPSNLQIVYTSLDSSSLTVELIF